MLAENTFIYIYSLVIHLKLNSDTHLNNINYIEYYSFMEHSYNKKLPLVFLANTVLHFQFF